MTDTLRPTEPGQPEPAPATAPRGGPPMASEEQRGAFVRLVIAIALGLALAARYGALKTVLVVMALLVMIMLHELGHFLTAKWGGMKVTEFFVGFGPRLWSVRKGETEYGVKALPVGGYVKIIGMHNLDRIEDPADEPRTYRQKPFPQRFAVAVAGSTMHFLIALVLFVAINVFVGIPGPSLEIADISKVEGERSPAEEAGFEVGDRIVSVDGRRVTDWDDIPPYIRARPETDITFVVDRDGAEVALVARPLDLRTVEGEDGKPVVAKPRGFIGIGPLARFETQGAGSVPMAFGQFLGGDFGDDPNQVAPGLLDNAKALGSVFSPSGLASYWDNLTGSTDGTASADDESTRFLSPVGFVGVAKQAADTGIFEVLVLLIAINLFVGLFNLLPFLPLDGGHVAVAVYELVRSTLRGGKRYFVDVAKLLPLTYVVVLLLVFLGLSSLYLDITDPLKFE
ncbi:MAG TPA: site-2 protease family protein [Acidimicrobiales bacterium]